MEILVKRYKKGDKFTIGQMFIDHAYIADTLERTDRGLTDTMSINDITKNKVYGQTAIPEGTYKVILSYSQRFKQILPELLDVKGFSGVRIHTGNTANDTIGCILVGRYIGGGYLTDSRMAFANIKNILSKNEEGDIKITITNIYK